MLTTADVTDRDGAVRMICRYCEATDYLDLLKKVMTDGGSTGEKSGKERVMSYSNDDNTFQR